MLLVALLLLSQLGFSQDQEIKTYSTEKWGSDYSMVKYEIEKQTKAKNDFLAYYKKNNCFENNKTLETATEECKILLEAYSKWSVKNTKQVDWSMVLYEADKQLEAYKNIK